MSYKEIAEKWLELAQRNAAGVSTCHDMLKGEGRLLCLLLESGGMTAGAIGGQTGNTTGRVANLLRQLEEKGLVSRRVGSHDKRQTLVSLTETGRKYAEKIKAANVAQEAAVLKTLGEKDALTLLDLFGKYLDAKEAL